MQPNVYPQIIQQRTIRIRNALRSRPEADLPKVGSRLLLITQVLLGLILTVFTKFWQFVLRSEFYAVILSLTFKNLQWFLRLMTNEYWKSKWSRLSFTIRKTRIRNKQRHNKRICHLNVVHLLERVAHVAVGVRKRWLDPRGEWSIENTALCQFFLKLYEVFRARAVSLKHNCLTVEFISTFFTRVF